MDKPIYFSEVFRFVYFDLKRNIKFKKDGFSGKTRKRD